MSINDRFSLKITIPKLSYHSNDIKELPIQVSTELVTIVQTIRMSGNINDVRKFRETLKGRVKQIGQQLNGFFSSVYYGLNRYERKKLELEESYLKAVLKEARNVEKKFAPPLELDDKLEFLELIDDIIISAEPAKAKIETVIDEPKTKPVAASVPEEKVLLPIVQSKITTKQVEAVPLERASPAAQESLKPAPSLAPTATPSAVSLAVAVPDAPLAPAFLSVPIAPPPPAAFPGASGTPRLSIPRRVSSKKVTDHSNAPVTKTPVKKVLDLSKHNKMDGESIEIFRIAKMDDSEIQFEHDNLEREYKEYEKFVQSLIDKIFKSKENKAELQAQIDLRSQNLTKIRLCLDEHQKPAESKKTIKQDHVTLLHSSIIARRGSVNPDETPPRKKTTK